MWYVLALAAVVLLYHSYKVKVRRDKINNLITTITVANYQWQRAFSSHACRLRNGYVKLHSFNTYLNWERNEAINDLVGSKDVVDIYIDCRDKLRSLIISYSKYYPHMHNIHSNLMDALDFLDETMYELRNLDRDIDLKYIESI